MFRLTRCLLAVALLVSASCRLLSLSPEEAEPLTQEGEAQQDFTIEVRYPIPYLVTPNLEFQNYPIQVNSIEETCSGFKMSVRGYASGDNLKWKARGLVRKGFGNVSVPAAPTSPGTPRPLPRTTDRTESR
jgi:hypothetical protein